VNLKHTPVKPAVKSLAVNAKVTLICKRCGIDFTIKLDAYNKRVERSAEPKLCMDCRPIRGQLNTTDLWEFVKTTLRLNAN